MPGEKQYIAIDIGAESGRVMLGVVANEKLALHEIYRFANSPVNEDGCLKWNFPRLLSEVKTGITKAIKQTKGKVDGIGVDTWGVDFGLLGSDGKLLENPYHYRDSHNNGMMEKAFELMPRREIYENTGLQFMQFNTIYQLLSMRLNKPDSLAKAKKLIFIADLFTYNLCGRAYCEYTFASTSQLMDMRTGKWSKAIYDKLNLPMQIMPEIVQPGTVVGTLKKELAKEFGCRPIPFIAVGEHDTASAVVAVPADGKSNWAYLSSGTWSLMGVEVPKAVIDDKTFKYEFTNEGGVENTIRLLKNIMGLWLVQECKRHWQKHGEDLSYGRLTEMAQKAVPFVTQIDPDCTDFLAPGDMPERINHYLTQKGQQPITDKGQMIRVILESLALKYRQVFERIEDITGKSIDCLHIVGGGIQNELLCQFTADAIGKKVITGPIEATAAGNILMQAKAVGLIKSLSDLRRIVRNSFELKEYLPQQVADWDKQYKKFITIS